ncbi:Uncharacterised protein [[Clostridium] symbiosum]|uniref:Uncharacterized protein n=1 Tax=[Clostridium] symbiosum ATCC 14940 TaxID=411472 RepID=A0ABC9TSB8_CLOSY|nr:hypothetical protein [[Clostridium] symbiosum]ERI74160.1 hypothetical protein CLOSYM_04280 [[Clostridium] symbiosum ATCC 14940]SUY60787.1 Uncharacterised protein [[Clostridium] symbiosum]
MFINTNISAFAQNNYDSTAIQSENVPSGSVIITENGVTINGVYYTKAEFTNLLNQAVEVSNSEDNGIQTRGPIAAGVYFIPGIGEVAIAATGAIVVAGVAVVAGTWLYKTSQARTIAKIRAKIPSRLRKENGDVDLGKFNEKVGGKNSYKEKGGWTIDKDTAGHGGRKWKLKDKAGNRVASLGENGEVLAK